MQRRLIHGIALTALGILCLLPVLVLFYEGLRTEGVHGLRAILLDSRQLGLLWNTTLLGAGTAACCVVVGGGVGFLLSRTDVPSRGLLRIACLAPVVVPPYVMGIAWTELINNLHGAGWFLWFPVLSGIPGSVFLLGASLYPIVVVLAERGFSAVDASVEEAALMQGGPLRVFWRVTLPMALPSILAGGLLVFAFAVSDFSIPDFLSFAAPADRRYQVFATEIYMRFKTLESSSEATIASLPVVGILVCVVLLLLRLEGRHGTLISGHLTRAPRRIQLGGHRASAFLAVFAVAGFTTLAPLGTLLWWAFRSGGKGRLAGLQSAFDEAGQDIGRSVLMCLGAGLLMAVVGFLVAHAAARARTPWRSRAIAALSLAPIAFPAVMLAVGEIRLWNHPLNPLSDAVYGSPALIMLAFAGRFLPLVVLMLRATLRGVDPALEEAAALSGRGFLGIITRVTFPLAARGVAAAGVVGFLLCMRELDVVAILPGGSDTLANRVYAMVHTSRDSIIAVLCLVLVVASAAPLLIWRLLDPHGGVDPTSNGGLRDGHPCG